MESTYLLGNNDEVKMLMELLKHLIYSIWRRRLVDKIVCQSVSKESRGPRIGSYGGAILWLVKSPQSNTLQCCQQVTCVHKSAEIADDGDKTVRVGTVEG